MKLIINTDGASRGNPGPAAYGFIIVDSRGRVVCEAGKRLGVTTNNVAEYTAVLAAFEYLFNHLLNSAPHQILVIADSQLIVRQLGGWYKVKSPHLKQIYNQIKLIELDLGTVSYKSVPREQNKRADALANQALDG